MEALTACAVAALTLYDMVKAVDRGMTIEALRLVEKSGGKSGPWRRREDQQQDSDGGSTEGSPGGSIESSPSAADSSGEEND